MKHSMFGGSSLMRRLYCPGSYFMEQDLPEVESKYAEMGIKLHKEVENRINKGQKILFEGTEEVAIQYCYNQYLNLVSNCHIKPEVFTEKSFDMSEIFSEIEITTADMVAIVGTVGYVYDWKFNYNDVEEVKHNLQLGLYALAVFREFPNITQCHVVIVEGFKEKTSSYLYNRDDCSNIIEFIKMIITNCNKSFAKLRPSKKTCQYCKAFIDICPAVQALLKDNKDLDEIKKASNLSSEEVGKLLDAAEINDYWAGKVKEYAYALAATGNKIEGWYMKPGKQIRSWKDDVTEQKLIELGQFLGKPVDNMSEVKLISPAELESKWGKVALIKQQILQLVDIKQCKPELKREKE